MGPPHLACLPFGTVPYTADQKDSRLGAPSAVVSSQKQPRPGRTVGGAGPGKVTHSEFLAKRVVGIRERLCPHSGASFRVVGRAPSPTVMTCRSDRALTRATVGGT